VGAALVIAIVALHLGSSQLRVWRRMSNLPGGGAAAHFALYRRWTDRIAAALPAGASVVVVGYPDAYLGLLTGSNLELYKLFPHVSDRDTLTAFLRDKEYLVAPALQDAGDLPRILDLRRLPAIRIVEGELSTLVFKLPAAAVGD
jgi:hypothetical protein